VIPQFFDVLEIKFQTEFKWDTNERGGMLQRMKIFYRLPLWGQRRRPPPVADWGRSCWGSGQQGASAIARSSCWEPQPGLANEV